MRLLSTNPASHIFILMTVKYSANIFLVLRYSSLSWNVTVTNQGLYMLNMMFHYLSCESEHLDVLLDVFLTD